MDPEGSSATRPASSEPALSIAMATFNGGRFIDAQLASLRSQTRLPAELVVTDDGSHDDTLDRVRRFAIDAPFPVTVVSNALRLGWRGNFMKAAGLCRGDLIAFCDQDDVWYPRKLEAAAALFADARTLLVHHDADVVDRDGRTLGTLRAAEADHAYLAPRTRPTTWSSPHGLTQVFRRVLLRFEPYWPLSIDPREPGSPTAHDQYYYYLASNLGSVRYTPERLLAYRQHGGNTVGFANVTARPRRTAAESEACGAAYRSMLAAFCRVLEAAERDGLARRCPELPAALEANRRLCGFLHGDHLARTDRPMGRRVHHLSRLLQARAYSRGTPWNLGYRALLNTVLLGIPFGR